MSFIRRPGGRSGWRGWSRLDKKESADNVHTFHLRLRRQPPDCAEFRIFPPLPSNDVAGTRVRVPPRARQTGCNVSHMRRYLARIGIALVIALTFVAAAARGGSLAMAAPEVSDWIGVGDSASAVAYDQTTRTLFVGADGAISVLKDGVPMSKIAVAAKSMAVNPVTHTVYALESTRNAVAVIDGTTVTATIPIPEGSQDLALDPGTGKIYIASGMVGVTVIEGDKVTGTIALKDEGYVWSIAVDSSTHAVYAGNYSKATVSVIVDGAVTKTIPAASGWSIAVDSVTHDVYVPGEFNKKVLVINGGAVVRAIDVPFPRDVAVDSSTHTAYVASPDLHTVSVIHGSAVSSLVSFHKPGRPVVDPVSHSVYVPSPVGAVAVIRDPSNRDFTSDGRIDVLARDGNGGLWLYPSNGSGGWFASGRVGQGWNSMTAIIAGGDFNTDGRADVLACDSAGLLWLYPGDGDGGWLPRFQVGQGWQSMTALAGAGDFDGDGFPDVLARDPGGDLWLYPGNGTGGWFPRSKVGQQWNGMTTILGAGDLNADEEPDVLARDSAGLLWVYPGDGAGGWLPRFQSGQGWNVMSAIMVPGDFTGDGRPDLLARDSTGILWLYPEAGDYGWMPRIQVGQGWNVMNAII